MNSKKNGRTSMNPRRPSAVRRWVRIAAPIGLAVLVGIVAIRQWPSYKASRRAQPGMGSDTADADRSASWAPGAPTPAPTLQPWESTPDNTHVDDPHLIPAWKVDPPRPILSAPPKPVEPPNPISNQPADFNPNGVNGDRPPRPTPGLN